MTERRRSMSTSSQPWLKFRPGNSTSRFGLFEGIAIALAHRHADELAESRRGELNPRSAPYQGAGERVLALEELADFDAQTYYGRWPFDPMRRTPIATRVAWTQDHRTSPDYIY